MKSEIIMLRHGITEGNKNKWFYGALDLHLLPEGKETLRKHKEEGWYPELPDNTKYFTTGLVRTKESLEILFGEQDYEEIPDLQEMAFGEYEARTFDEMKDDPIFRNWTHDETGEVGFPGGETKNEFAFRVRRGLGTLIEKHSEHEEEARAQGKDAVTVLICHGGVIAGLMHDIFPGERETMWDWMVDPGSGYIIELKDGKPCAHCQIGDKELYYGEKIKG